MKSFKTLGLAIVLTLTFSIAAFGNTGNMSLQKVSEITGYTVEDLQEYKDNVGDMFESEIERLIDFALEDQDNNIRMSITGLPFEVSSYAQIGDIHVTSQNKNVIRHGHAALAINHVFNLEIDGPGYLSEIQNNESWNNYNSYALMRMNSSSASLDDRTVAVTYGVENLQGLEYFALSSTNGDKVNCASLVTKTYKQSGVLDMYPWQGGLTVLPIDLVNSIHTYKVITSEFPW